MGVYDFTKPALKELGAEIFFERVALRPGKADSFARLGKHPGFRARRGTRFQFL